MCSFTFLGLLRVGFRPIRSCRDDSSSKRGMGLGAFSSIKLSILWYNKYLWSIDDWKLNKYKIWELATFGTRKTQRILSNF